MRTSTKLSMALSCAALFLATNALAENEERGRGATAASGAPSGSHTAPDGASFRVGDFRLLPLADIRLRGELRKGPTTGSVPAASTAWVGGVAERTRIGIDVRRGDTVRAVVQLQDARILGDAPQGNVGVARPASFGIFEAFVEVRGRHSGSPRGTTSDVDDGPFVRIGRQRLTVADGILVGANDWSHTGRSLDAIRAEIPWGRVRFGAFGALLSTGGNSGVDLQTAVGGTARPAHLEGVTIRWEPHELVRVEAVGLYARRYQTTSKQIHALPGDSSLGTVGARMYGEKKGIRYQLFGAYQMGTRTVSGESHDVGSYAVSGYIQRRHPQLYGNPTFRLGGAWASGNRQGSARLGAFDPLLPDAQQFGLLDAAALTNLISGHAAVTLEPGEPTRLSLRYQYSTPERKYGGDSDASLTPYQNGTTVFGARHEVDAQLTYTPARGVEVRAGYGMIFGATRTLATNSLSSIPFSQAPRLAFAQIRFTL